MINRFVGYNDRMLQSSIIIVKQSLVVIVIIIIIPCAHQGSEHRSFAVREWECRDPISKPVNPARSAPSATVTHACNFSFAQHSDRDHVGVGVFRQRCRLVRGRGRRAGRARRVPVLDVDVRPLERPERAVRAAAGAVVRQHTRPGHRRGAPDARVPAAVHAVRRPAVRGPVPDAHAVPDGARPGAGPAGADQGLCALHRPRAVRVRAAAQPAGQRAVLHERRPVEDHARQAQPGVHGRQAAAHARSDRRV